jgi:hypothetical protein
MVECGLDSFGKGQGPVAGSCEHVNEPSGYVKCEEFLAELSDYSFTRMAVTERVIVAVTL